MDRRRGRWTSACGPGPASWRWGSRPAWSRYPRSIYSRRYKVPSEPPDCQTLLCEPRIVAACRSLVPGLSPEIEYCEARQFDKHSYWTLHVFGYQLLSVLGPLIKEAGHGPLLVITCFCWMFCVLLYQLFIVFGHFMSFLISYLLFLVTSCPLLLLSYCFETQHVFC